MKPRKPSFWHLVGFVLLAHSLAACAIPSEIEPPASDAGPGTDSSTDGATTDTSTDAGPPDSGTDSGTDAGADSGTDSNVDAGCPPDLFSAPVNVTELNSTDTELAPWLQSDNLRIIFSSSRAGSMGGTDTWHAVRPDPLSPFATPSLTSNVNSNSEDLKPILSDDGLTLYFASNRSGAAGFDIFMATRPGPTGAFGAPTPVAELNTADHDFPSYITPDELTIYIASDRTGTMGSYDVYVATRTGTGLPFDPPTNVTELNSTDADLSAMLDASGLTLYMTSFRTGDYDVYFATRPDTSSPFSTPAPITVVNSSADDSDVMLTPDGTGIYIASNRAGSSGDADIWFAPRACP